MTDVSYQVFMLDLTTAGTRAISAVGDLLHVQNMENGGALDLSGKIGIRPGSRSNNPYITMYINHSLKTFSREFELQWDAQPGITATIIVTQADQMAVSSPPARQLVTSSVGTTLTTSAVAVNDTRDLLAAANASRQAVTIQNLGGDDIYIGGVSVTVANGIKVVADSAFVWDANTAALYAICDTGLSADVRVAVEA